MALNDILAAIVAQADQQIEDARQRHKKHLSELREKNERAIAKKKQEIAVQKEQKKQQLQAKAETHVSMLKRNALLLKKQQLLNETYAMVVEKLSSLSSAEAESLLRACVKQIKAKGVLHPAKGQEDVLKKIAPSEQFTIGDSIKAKGGFLFVSEKEEQNFTYEHLVSHLLRPHTEVDTAHELFS